MPGGTVTEASAGGDPEEPAETTTVVEVKTTVVEDPTTVLEESTTTTVMDEESTTEAATTVMDEESTTEPATTVVDEESTTEVETTVMDEESTTEAATTVVDEESTTEVETTVMDEESTTESAVTTVMGEESTEPPIEDATTQEIIEPTCAEVECEICEESGCRSNEDCEDVNNPYCVIPENETEGDCGPTLPEDEPRCHCPNGTPGDDCAEDLELKCNECFDGWTGIDCSTPISCTCPNGTPAALCESENEVLCASCNDGWNGPQCTDPCTDVNGDTCLRGKPEFTQCSWQNCEYAGAYCNDPVLGASARECCPAACGVCIEEADPPCSGLSFNIDGFWEDAWNSIERSVGVYTINYFTYEAGCFCMFNDWISGLSQICPDNYNYFKFKLKGGRWGRTSYEEWEVYLYGDGTVKVVVDGNIKVDRGQTSGDFLGGAGFGPTINDPTDHTTFELCLKSDAGSEIELQLADPVSEANNDGECTDVPPTEEPTTCPCYIDGDGNLDCSRECPTPDPCPPMWPNACSTHQDCASVPDKPWCATPVEGQPGTCQPGSCPAGYTACETCCDRDATCECDDDCSEPNSDMCSIPHDAYCTLEATACGPENIFCSNIQPPRLVYGTPCYTPCLAYEGDLKYCMAGDPAAGTWGWCGTLCARNECTCENGTPATNCVESTTERCIRCNPGWAGEDCKTPQYPCECPNGVPDNVCTGPGQVKCSKCDDEWVGLDCATPAEDCSCGVNGIPFKKCHAGNGVSTGRMKCESCNDGFTGPDCTIPTLCNCPGGIADTDCTSQELKCTTQDCICRNGTPDQTNYCTMYHEEKCGSCYAGWMGSDCQTPIPCSCPNGTPLTHCATENEVRCLVCNSGFTGEDCETPIYTNVCTCPNGTPGAGCTFVDQVKCASCDMGWEGDNCDVAIVCTCPNGTPGAGCVVNGGVDCDSCSVGFTGADCETPVRCTCPNGTPEEGTCTWNGEVRCSNCNGGYTGIDCSTPPQECACLNGVACDLGTCTNPGQTCCKQCNGGWTGTDCEIEVQCECPNGTPDTGCARVGVTLCSSCNPGWTGTDCNTRISCACDNGTPATDCTFENEQRCSSCNAPDWALNPSTFLCEVNTQPCVCPNGTPANDCTSSGELKCSSCNKGWTGDICEDVCNDFGAAECLASKPGWDNTAWQSCSYVANGNYCTSQTWGADSRECCPATCGVCEYDPPPPCQGFGLTYDGLWEDWWATDSERMVGVYTINYIKYADGCFCMFNDWLSGQGEICPDNYNYFQFSLKGGGWWPTTYEEWEVYLYGDGTMEVSVNGQSVLERGDTSGEFIGGAGFGPSPNNNEPHTTYEICFVSDAGMDFQVNLADPYSESDTSGECSSVPPTPDPTTFGCGVDADGVPKDCTNECTAPPCDPQWPGACTSNSDCTDPDNPFCATPVPGSAGVCKPGTCDPGYTYCELCCDIDCTCECDDVCRLENSDDCNIPHNPNVQCQCPNGIPANDCSTANDVKCVSCNKGWHGESCDVPCNDQGAAQCLASKPGWDNTAWQSCSYIERGDYCTHSTWGADSQECCPATCGVCEYDPPPPCQDFGLTYDGLWEDWWATDAERMVGVYTINYIKYQDGCFCMFNDWLSGQGEICPDNYNWFQFSLKGGGWWATTYETWEVYLYGDGTMRVLVDDVVRLERGETSGEFIGGAGFGPSPNNNEAHTTYELCFVSDAGMDFEVDLADPTSESNTNGECSSVTPTPDPTTFGCSVDDSGNQNDCTNTCGDPSGICEPSWPGACTSNADCTDPSNPYCATPVPGTPGVCKPGTCDQGYTYCEDCCDIDPTCECDDVCTLPFGISECSIPHGGTCTCENGVPDVGCSSDASSGDDCIIPAFSPITDQGFTCSGDKARGWFDVQGQGVCNDFCRWVGNGGCDASGTWWGCALAGGTTEWQQGYSAGQHARCAYQGEVVGNGPQCSTSEEKCASCDDWLSGETCSDPGPGRANTGTCDHVIQTKEDCEAAAATLGLSDVTAGDMGGSSKPAGCWWDGSAGIGFELKWNGLLSSEGECSDTHMCICELPNEDTGGTCYGSEAPAGGCAGATGSTACQDGWYTTCCYWDGGSCRERTCNRPGSGCTGPNDLYWTGDCDGDGIDDHVCATTYNNDLYMVLSTEGTQQGCHDSWGGANRNCALCPDGCAVKPPTNQPSTCHRCEALGDPHMTKFNGQQDDYYSYRWVTYLDLQYEGRDRLVVDVHHGPPVAPDDWNGWACIDHIIVSLGGVQVCEYTGGVVSPSWVVYRNDLLSTMDAWNPTSGLDRAFTIAGYPELKFQWTEWQASTAKYLDARISWCAPGGFGYTNEGTLMNTLGLCMHTDWTIRSRRTLTSWDVKQSIVSRRRLQEVEEEPLPQATCANNENCCERYKNHPFNYNMCLTDGTLTCCPSSDPDCCDLSGRIDLCPGLDDSECPEGKYCGSDGQCFDEAENGCKGEWSAFSECNTSCGLGYRSKTFTVTEFGWECDYEDQQVMTEKCSRGPCGDVCEGVVCDPTEMYGEGTCYGYAMGTCVDASADMGGMKHYYCDFSASKLPEGSPCIDGPTCLEEDCVCTAEQSCVTTTFRDTSAAEVCEGDDPEWLNKNGKSCNDFMEELSEAGRDCEDRSQVLANCCATCQVLASLLN